MNNSSSFNGISYLKGYTRIDENFVKERSEEKIKELAKIVEENLNLSGYSNIRILINYEYFEKNYNNL